MTQAEELYHTVHHRPFQPLRVHLKDGRTYDILSERLAIVGVTYLHIGMASRAQLSDPWPLYDHVVTVDLVDIDRVERLPAAVSSVSG